MGLVATIDELGLEALGAEALGAEAVIETYGGMVGTVEGRTSG